MIDFISEQFYFYMSDNDAEPIRIRQKIERARWYFFNMLSRTQGMFKWEGLPETLPARNLELILQGCGNACVTEVNGDLYAFWGGLGGEPDAYYEPTIYTVANPALNFSANLKIGTECVRVRNDATGQSLAPLNARYADMLAENDITMIVRDILYRMPALLSASDDRTAESARQFLDDIITGKLGIISESEFFDGIKTSPADATGKNQTDLIEYAQYLKASWFNELGINANYNMKRERLQADEVGMNEDALLTYIENMLQCREEGAEKINELYGLQISVELSGAWKKEQEKQLLDIEAQKMETGGVTSDNKGPNQTGADTVENDDSNTQDTDTVDNEPGKVEGEQGAENGEQGAENGEQGAENGEQQAENGEIDNNITINIEIDKGGDEIEKDTISGNDTELDE